VTNILGLTLSVLVSGREPGIELSTSSLCQSAAINSILLYNPTGNQPGSHFTSINEGQSYPYTQPPPSTSHRQQPPHLPTQSPFMNLRSSHLTIAASATIYPLLLRLFSGPSPTLPRFSKAIKGTSTIHSTLTTLLALYFLHNQQWRASSPPPVSTRLQDAIAGKGGYPDDSHNPLISARSDFGNVITALEAGYLLQDTFALLYLARLHDGRQWRKSLDKTLVTHHVTTGTALLVLHYYISRSREAGIVIIVQLLLMNASTPILNIRWYLRNFARERRKSILAADVAFVGAFFVARVWLVGKILRDYGAFHGWSVWEAYRYGLRVPCRLGTGALLAANASWWVQLVVNTVGRSTRFTLGGQ